MGERTGHVHKQVRAQKRAGIVGKKRGSTMKGGKIWDRRKQAKLKFAGSFIAIYDVFSSFSRVFN